MKNDTSEKNENIKVRFNKPTLYSYQNIYDDPRTTIYNKEKNTVEEEMYDNDEIADAGSNSTLDISGNKINNDHKIQFRKYKYREMEKIVEENYFDKNHKYSSSLDIIASYLRGQKLIYMESKAYCENYLNCLMMPSILLSTAATVLSAVVKDFYWGSYMLAGVNEMPLQKRIKYQLINMINCRHQ